MTDPTPAAVREARNPLMTSWEARAAAIIAGSLAEVDSPYAGGVFSDYRTHAINLCATLTAALSDDFVRVPREIVDTFSPNQKKALREYGGGE
jgi:hypothetical protein